MPHSERCYGCPPSAATDARRALPAVRTSARRNMRARRRECCSSRTTPTAQRRASRWPYMGTSTEHETNGQTLTRPSPRQLVNCSSSVAPVCTRSHVMGSIPRQTWNHAPAMKASRAHLRGLPSDLAVSRTDKTSRPRGKKTIPEFLIRVIAPEAYIANMRVALSDENTAGQRRCPDSV
ncbi:hypothetical protein OBBRIDRAFT_611173 [Obba rivulosa]|uniref:Uncharacterized protein n=1 Tax=Obba rivulosa TaxID=1052685 RepID=A0A8E2J5S7_9APHY|nr:hypothetical protein OBBRIDRAFT_611173 [Obba rivulosa]